ncbi:ABC transporter permease [Pseudonocardia humida]|uniref:ABC transporter permease n=1 Tax=Pseudonocardia humida TaxID=2800819 RepID=A0ABT1A9K0_9PSEU|nr:ABC transporter permease [Pseudonocardia humida]MCO1659710.1 ABC transporter permease [Pseudonocardia humida]
MLRIIGRRLVQLVPTALLATIVTFALLQLSPGGPATTIAGPDASPESIAQIESELGLDEPVALQYWNWLTNALTGDLGSSFIDRAPVTETLARAAPVTLEIAGLALAIATVVGVPLGVVSAVRRRSVLDESIRNASGLGIAVPEFWLAMIAIYLFALQLGWLPSGGFEPLSDGLGANLESVLMPAAVLATSGAAILTRQARSGMIRALDSKYVLAARAAGVRPSDIYLKLAVRNSLIPVVTVMGLVAGTLIGGSVLVERVFVLPGMGSLLIDSALAKDYPVTQGVMVVLIGLILVITLLVDVSYGLLDPRTRRS